jgi:hypothetical protein
LFTPQIIHKHGEPWWNDIGKGKLLIRPQELPGNPTSREAGGTREENYEFGLTKYLCSYLKEIFNMPKNLRTWDRRLTSPPKEGVLRIFIALKSPSPSAGFQPANHHLPDDGGNTHL